MISVFLQSYFQVIWGLMIKISFEYGFYRKTYLVSMT